jgi:hypothetical protein
MTAQGFITTKEHRRFLGFGSTPAREAIKRLETDPPVVSYPRRDLRHQCGLHGTRGRVRNPPAPGTVGGTARSQEGQHRIAAGTP